MAVKPIYAVGLDAGSRYTRLAICTLEGGRLRYLGGSAVESQGWLKGRIADQRAVTDCIVAAVREAEANAGVIVEAVVAGVGGQTVRGSNGRGVVELGHTREIEQRDVNRVVDRASHVQLQEDRMVLQLFPQDFVVDDHPGHRDPRKMMASRLEINVHLVTTSVQEHAALVGAINQAHLVAEETIFEGLASCYAAVLPEERREGVAVVDIGAQSTELVVYYGDSMYLASTVKVCGDHFTRDLAQGLCISYEDAETVKLEYGSALSEICPENVLVELPTPENRERRQEKRRFINQILEARADELFQYVRAELVRVGMDRALIGGVFLTGAAARLPDLCDVAERVLMCQARYGLTIGIEGWPEAMKDPEWSAVAGLAMYSAKLKAQMEQARETAGWLGRILK
ncbi:MAG TPA: cell division protein FtsA [Candidatus Sulfopaludibacter sp.]|jgi:cell division protein FtsA|nr:cell division protein FtsA [Candidatus Sulfopaludibacter sp.]